QLAKAQGWSLLLLLLLAGFPKLRYKGWSQSPGMFRVRVGSLTGRRHTPVLGGVAPDGAGGILCSPDQKYNLSITGGTNPRAPSATPSWANTSTDSAFLKGQTVEPSDRAFEELFQPSFLQTQVWKSLCVLRLEISSGSMFVLLREPMKERDREQTGASRLRCPVPLPPSSPYPLLPFSIFLFHSLRAPSSLTLSRPLTFCPPCSPPPHFHSSICFPPCPLLPTSSMAPWTLTQGSCTPPCRYKSNEEYVYVRGRGRGKYVCEECGIRCKKPSMLKKHIRTHTDVRPYVCKHCNFAFKTKGNLTKHMKSKAHGKKCQEISEQGGPSLDELEAEDGGGEQGVVRIFACSQTQAASRGVKGQAVVSRPRRGMKKSSAAIKRNIWAACAPGLCGDKFRDRQSHTEPPPLRAKDKPFKPAPFKKSFNEGPTCLFGGGEERVGGPEDQEEHQFSDVDDSEDDDDNEEEEEEESSSHDEPPSSCSPDTRLSSGGRSDSGLPSQRNTPEPHLPAAQERDPGPSQQDYPSPRKLWPSGRASSPGSKRALFSPRGPWETSPRAFSPSGEGSPLRHLSPGRGISPGREVSPLRCLSPRLEVSPNRHLSPSPERGPSPIRPLSPGRYPSPRALPSPIHPGAHSRVRGSPIRTPGDTPSTDPPEGRQGLGLALGVRVRVRVRVWVRVRGLGLGFGLGVRVRVRVSVILLSSADPLHDHHTRVNTYPFQELLAEVMRPRQTDRRLEVTQDRAVSALDPAQKPPHSAVHAREKTSKRECVTLQHSVTDGVITSTLVRLMLVTDDGVQHPNYYTAQGPGSYLLLTEVSEVSLDENTFSVVEERGMFPEACLFPPALRLSPLPAGESGGGHTSPRRLDHVFSHLPLHSRQGPRAACLMIPIGGIQMVQPWPCPPHPKPSATRPHDRREAFPPATSGRGILQDYRVQEEEAAAGTSSQSGLGAGRRRRATPPDKQDSQTGGEDPTDTGIKQYGSSRTRAHSQGSTLVAATKVGATTSQTSESSSADPSPSQPAPPTHRTRQLSDREGAQGGRGRRRGLEQTGGGAGGRVTASKNKDSKTGST
ncbi:hypothetical protein JZ751_015487, partial [Albula glossodonta]